MLALDQRRKTRYHIPAKRSVRHAMLTEFGVDPSAGMIVRREKLERGVKGFAESLDVHFINTLPVLAASCHSRESGNPGDECHGDWMPAYAGMTFSWRRTYETDI